MDTKDGHKTSDRAARGPWMVVAALLVAATASVCFLLGTVERRDRIRAWMRKQLQVEPRLTALEEDRGFTRTWRAATEVRLRRLEQSPPAPARSAPSTPPPASIRPPLPPPPSPPTVSAPPPSTDGIAPGFPPPAPGSIPAAARTPPPKMAGAASPPPASYAPAATVNAPSPGDVDVLKADMARLRETLTRFDPDDEDLPGFRFRLERADAAFKSACTVTPAAIWDPEKNGDVHRETVDALQKDVNAVRAGQSLLVPYARLLLAYRSRVDDSDQPYHVALPADYDPASGRRWPLAVFLHGQGMYGGLQGRPQPIDGWVVVSPHGRGGMDYQWVAEKDILDVVAVAQRRFAVDPDRVVLTGSSMGGSGSWHLGTRFSDRWAGIAPVCGVTDISPWFAVYGSATPPDAPQRAIRDFLRHDTAALPYAENLLPLPVVALHGQRDAVNAVDNARAMRDRLIRLGHSNAQFTLYPFVRHGIDVDYDALLAAADFRRNPRPGRVRHTASWLRHGRAFWVRIAGLRHIGRAARVDAQWMTPSSNAATGGHAASNMSAPSAVHAKGRVVVAVSTQGMSALRLYPARGPRMATADAPRPDDFHWTVDGQSVDVRAAWRDRAVDDPDADRRDEPVLDAYFDGTAWRPGTRPFAPTTTPPPGGWPLPPVAPKSAGLEGPVEHAFMDRFVLIAPDAPAKDDRSDAAARRRAARAAEAVMAAWWHRRFQVDPIRRTASTLTDEDRAEASHWIVFGDARDHPEAARVADRFPWRVEPDAADGAVRAADGSRYAGENAGFVAGYPDPDRPGRYIVLYAGTTPRAYEDVVTRFGNWFDWVPYYHRPHYDYAVFDDRTTGRDPETFLTWGFFGPDWRFDPASRFEGDAAMRGALTARAHPHPDTWRNAAPTASPVGLEDGASSVSLDNQPVYYVSAPREQLERNRRFDGRPLRLGTRTFARGLAMRYDGSATFNTVGHRRFVAVAGALPGTRPRFGPPTGTPDYATFAVLTRPEAKGPWTEVFTARHEPGTPGVVIDVPVPPAGQVQLSVTGGMSWWHGECVWGDARLTDRAPKEDIKKP